MGSASATWNLNQLLSKLIKQSYYLKNSNSFNQKILTKFHNGGRYLEDSIQTFVYNNTEVYEESENLQR